MPEVKGESEISYSDPYAGLMAGLAGISGVQTREGFEPWFRIGPESEAAFKQMGYKAGPTLFDDETMQSMIDFIRKPEQIGVPGVFARSEEGPLSLESLKESLANYNTASAQQRGVLAEGLDTGFKVDVNMDPIREAALYQLKNETVPGISEAFAGTAGLASSDFGGALAGAAGSVTSDLGALEAKLKYESGEAAAGRRAGLLQAAPAITTGMLGAPAAWGEMLGNIESGMRMQSEQTRPGAREFDAFMALIGADPGAYLSEQPYLDATGAEKFGQILGPLGDIAKGAAGAGG
jgi:hypothetical protein